MNKKYLIKGSGIAGQTAAIILARKGIASKIFEKRENVGSYFKKDVHSLKNYDQKKDVISQLQKMGIEIKKPYPVHQISYISPDNTKYRIFSDNNPLFYNITRGNQEESVDKQLFHIAKSLNVEYEFNFNPDKEVFNIIASGSQKIDGVGYGEHLSNVPLEGNYIFQNEDLAPGGYIYLSPTFNNEASLVITSFKQGFNIVEAYKKLLYENEIIKELLKNSKSIYTIQGSGGYNLPKKAKINNQYYIGEAAGFCDASRGFGTYYAITSAYLAAKAIAENLDYDKLWKKSFGKELFERFARRQYLNTMTNEDHNIIIKKTIQEYGTEIPIEIYQKRKNTAWHKKFLLNIYSRYKLIGWRKRHPLK